LTEFTTKARRIAIVEDDVYLSKVYAQILRQHGFEVSFASITGEEILNAIAKPKSRDTFDLVIMDYELPGGMNGLETAKEIASLSPRTQILMVTGNASIEREATSAGFGFLLKPFEISKLLHCIDSRFNGKIEDDSCSNFSHAPFA
jgi:DNA-binding response OmpR family regulator